LALSSSHEGCKPFALISLPTDTIGKWSGESRSIFNPPGSMQDEDNSLPVLNQKMSAAGFPSTFYSSNPEEIGQVC